MSDQKCADVTPPEEGTCPPDRFDYCVYRSTPGLAEADKTHRCDRNPGHAGVHACKCGAVWARGELLTGYKCLTYQTTEPEVTGEVPLVILLDLEILSRERFAGISVGRDGAISMGRHANGGLVWYQVIGWDPARAALVMELDEQMYEATRKDRTDG
jgi:hypothetical protein